MEITPREEERKENQNEYNKELFEESSIQIKIPRIYEHNIALLYNLRNMFVMSEGFYETIIAKFLP